MSEAEDIADERRRSYIALIPLVVALPGLILALVLWFLPRGSAIPVIFGIVVAILAFDLPACIYVLIPWLRTGKPPELSFAPLLSSPEVRRFHRHLQKRPKLNDDDFYNVYFVDTAFPKKLPVQFRRLLEQQLGLDLGGLRPDDDLACVSDELDISKLIRQIEKDFEITIPWGSWNAIDGTFSSLLAAIQNAATHNT